MLSLSVILEESRGRKAAKIAGAVGAAGAVGVGGKLAWDKHQAASAAPQQSPIAQHSLVPGGGDGAHVNSPVIAKLLSSKPPASSSKVVSDDDHNAEGPLSESASLHDRLISARLMNG